MNERKPYDQGWLDGVNAQARDDAAWAERANRVAAATAKLAEAMDQSALITQLRADLARIQTAHNAMRARAESAESERDTAQALLDEAIELLEKWHAGFNDLGVEYPDDATRSWLSNNQQSLATETAHAALQAKVARAVALLQPRQFGNPLAQRVLEVLR
jgi:hypothetical protein